MKLTLINPPLCSLNGDPFGGIPSIPVGITYLAGYLREKGVDVGVVDAFGSAPLKKTVIGKNAYYGLSLRQILSRVDTTIVGISVHSGVQEEFCLNLIKELKKLGKTLLVGGAAPTFSYKKYINAGADYVVLGEGEDVAYRVLCAIENGDAANDIPGLVGQDFLNIERGFIKELDSIAYPAVDLLPLKNYWDLGYAHGPITGRYMFLITSRGCPYDCNFCAAPEMWKKKWRVRSVKDVVDEMEYHVKKFDIKDFHIQDDNFTFNPNRTKEFCREILSRGLKVNWKLPAGVKIETIDSESVKLMSESGCNYLAFSPESGSPRMLKLMNKPFNHNYGVRMVKEFSANGIKVQSCFVLGYPGETNEDLGLTKSYVRQLIKAGVDEVALYVMCPLPGANVPQVENRAISFSPRWRSDYKKLNRVRQKLYIEFIVLKSIYHPLKMLKSAWNVLTGRYELKIEMTLYRLWRTLF